MEFLICTGPIEAAVVMKGIRRLSAIIEGQDFPYTVPRVPADRQGKDDGSTVVVRRHVRVMNLQDGTLGIPITNRVRNLLTSGRLGDVAELTPLQRNRLLAIWAARRTVVDTELIDTPNDVDG